MYICDIILSIFIHTEIAPVESLLAIDQCTDVQASWNISGGYCAGISYDYNVTITSSDGAILQGPFTTNNTTYTFTNAEILNGTFNVTVFAFIGSVMGGSATQTTVIGVSQDGQLLTTIRDT